MIAGRLLLVTLCAGALAQTRNPVEAGTTALNRNDLASAQANFERATRREPKNPKAWLLLAQTHARRKNQPQAIEAARKAEILGAEDPAILQGLANFYATLLPDAPKAASLGERYAERAPADRNAWQRLAEFCLSTGQHDKAIRAANRALNLNPYAKKRISSWRRHTSCSRTSSPLRGSWRTRGWYSTRARKLSLPSVWPTTDCETFKKQWTSF